MKQKKMIGRVLALGLCVLMLCVSLVACGGGGTEINSTWTAADADAEIYFSRILPQSAEAREKFVAASRGYNMSDPNFDDSKVELGVVLPVDVEAAKLALDIVAPKDDASVLKYNEFRDALTAEQVIEIVNRMRAVNTVDLTENGFFLLVWIGKFLSLFGNYVFALFVFAIIIEVLLLYFGIRQQKNSIKQAKLSPKERAIRKKYAGRNDQVSMRKMQEEIQRLYQEEGFNPMSGCLPLLIQMPIVIALYKIVIDPLKYVLGKAVGLSAALTTFATTSRAAGGLGIELSNKNGTIELLSQVDVGSASVREALGNFSYFSNAADCANALSDVTVPKFSLFGLNMGITPSFKPVDSINFWLLLIPVLTFVVYFVSMKLNRKFMYQPAVQDPQVGCSNNMMDITMPLMSVLITFSMPAAVGVYWIFKCIIGVVKQFILHKLMPLPTFTEEDYRKAEKEVKAKSKGKREPVVVSAASGQTYRSLHHIDDDDDLPPKGMVAAAVTKHDEEIEEAPATEQAPDDGRPVLKEDRKNKDKK